MLVSAVTQPTLNELALVEEVISWDGGEYDGRLRRRVRTTTAGVFPVIAGCPPTYLHRDIVVVAGCGTGVDDERTQMIGEYWWYVINWIPVCGDFTQGASSAHFSFAELNTGDYSWAIIRDRLLAGLENTRSNYRYPMPVNSGYRNPHHQAIVNPGAMNSRHVYGDAADIDVRDNNGDGSLADDERLLVQAAQAAGAWTQIYSGHTHVHMDWGH